MQSLHSLPPVKLHTTCRFVTRGAEKVARVQVTNPTSQMAFFVQLALTQGRNGREILPVLWDDNYFSLLPGETRQVTATFVPKDAGGVNPTLEAGGWNVETDFDCSGLAVSSREVKPGERVTVTATVANTFLDGSRVFLQVDGKPTDFRWVWARGDRKQMVAFPLAFDRLGKRTLVVGDKKLELTVRP